MANRRGTARRDRTAIVAGNAALGRSEWELARASFEGALRLEETPEALEGLGMAAFWLDDGRTVFAARERAYRLYRQRGDRRGAGRVAMSLADDYLAFRGEAPVARGWLERSRRLLDGLTPIPEQGWLKLWDGHFSLLLGGNPAGVQKLAVEAAATARGLHDVDLEMTALALEGLALVVQGEPTAGMSRLDEATAAAVSGEMTDPVAIARACCLLVTACERIRDFDRAAQWCHRIREFCERTRFNFPVAVCRTDYAFVLVWRGSWMEAEGEFQAALRLLEPTRPGLQPVALAGLAELRRQQGRLDEAAALLQRIDGHPLSILGRAALALDRGLPAEAARLAQCFLRQLSRRNRAERVAALDVLLRAQVALGQRPESRSTLEKLAAVAGLFDTEPMRAAVLVGQGLVGAAEGDLDGARNAFEDACELYARSGASFEQARCRIELARVLSALGERAEADAELAKALLVFERLGAAHHLAAAGDLRRALSSSPRATALTHGSSARLTRREVEVLRLVAQGMSNLKIAERLIVSEFTIKRHVANLLAKLSLPSRAAAAAFAAREGIA